MFEFVYRYDPTDGSAKARPATPAEARQRLEEGNARFAALLTASPDAPADQRRVVVVDDLWAVPPGAHSPVQQPFAAVVGCSDARVPLEIIFGEGFNDIFVVRVAGNVLGSECLGSLDYAVTNLAEALKLVVVLGHSGCGAVTAAVNSYLAPEKYLATAPNQPLRAIVDKILLSVRVAHRSLEDAWGPGAADRPEYRQALIETAVGLNTALVAATVRRELRDHLGPDREVVYGVYDFETRRVGVALGERDGIRFTPGLVPAPADLEGFHKLGVELAATPSARGRTATA